MSLLVVQNLNLRFTEPARDQFHRQLNSKRISLEAKTKQLEKEKDKIVAKNKQIKQQNTDLTIKIGKVEKEKANIQKEHTKLEKEIKLQEDIRIRKRQLEDDKSKVRYC